MQARIIEFRFCSIMEHAHMNFRDHHIKINYIK
jgi:hypothetical protein